MNVTISGRTLYKDGAWNTLCLPFGVSEAQITAFEAFSGCTIMELDAEGWYDSEGKTRYTETADGRHKTSLAGDGTLYLYFQPVTAIEAGKPYLICWGTPDSPADADNPIVTPTFNVSYIESSTPGTITSDDGKVQFKGNFDPVSFTDGQSVLYLGADNTLYAPKGNRTMNAFRAYFQLNGSTSASAYVLSFGEGNETTGIIDAPRLNNKEKIINNKWYDLQGRKLTDRPTAKGIYIQSGKKVVIK